MIKVTLKTVGYNKHPKILDRQNCLHGIPKTFVNTSQSSTNALPSFKFKILENVKTSKSGFKNYVKQRFTSLRHIKVAHKAKN